MVTPVHPPLTFIDASPLSSTTGRQLSLVRSHTAALQQRQRRKKPWRPFKHPGITFVGVHMDQNSPLEMAARDHRLYNGDVLRSHGSAASDGGAYCVCRHIPASAHAASRIEADSSDSGCAFCHSPSAQAVVSAFGSLPTESHRKDPFDCLPMPSNNEVNTILDFCEILAFGTEAH
jgi:hypothetical protein